MAAGEFALSIRNMPNFSNGKSMGERKELSEKLRQAVAVIETIQGFITPQEGECWLEKEHPADSGRKWGQCCCSCKYLLTDYWYCQRMPDELKTEGHCGCEVVRGYICVAGEIHGNVSGQSGWPHHSIGCECFSKRDDAPPTTDRKGE